MFKTLAALVAVLALLAFASFSYAPTTTSPGGTLASPLPTSTPQVSPEDTQQYEWLRVIKVVDGDTIVVEKDGSPVTVRLIGLDTPETVDPRKPVQCFGREASEKMRQVVGGQSVRLEGDPSQGELDKYGRLLAYVFVPANATPDGILVNKYMIAEGYGHEYTYDIPYKYMEEFKAAERGAREAKRGLWADAICANDSVRRPSEPAGTPATTTNQYECMKNAHDCSDFSSQAEAQRVFNACGGAGRDIHQLDRNGDGEACESLP